MCHIIGYNFLESDEELKAIVHKYGPPTKDNSIHIMTLDVKKIMGKVVVDYLKQHQEKKH